MFNKPFLLIICIFQFYVLTGQNIGHHSKKATKLFAQLINEQNDKNLVHQIEVLKKIISLDSTIIAAYKLLAVVNSKLGNFKEADSIFLIYQNKGIFTGRQQKDNNDLHANYLFAIHHAQNNSIQDLNLWRLPINTIEDEYYPFYAEKDKVFYFTRRIQKEREESYIANVEDTIFKNLRIFNFIDLETPYQGALSINKNNSKLYFAANLGNEKGYGGLDIYLCEKNNNQWSIPINLGLGINSPDWDSSPAISADDSLLFFSSTRPGGYGGNDLYYSKKLVNGHWGKPINLGPKINTNKDEAYPYFHYDNETLYFTSSGLPGYGGTDLFVCKKNGDNFTTPMNLGYPINTVYNEGAIRVNEDGKTAFFNSDNFLSIGGMDIFRITLPIVFRALPAITQKIQIDSANIKPSIPNYFDSIIISQNNTFSLKNIYFAKDSINIDTRNFKFLNQLVDFLIKKDQLNVLITGQTDPTDNESYNKNLSYKRALSIQRYLHEKGISLPRLQVDGKGSIEPLETNSTHNKTFILKNIYFATESFNLDTSNFQFLNQFVDYLIKNNQLNVLITGHADRTGNEIYNKMLSYKRALRIQQYLHEKGISLTRLQLDSKGSTEPLESNTTNKGREMNRRVSFNY